MSRSAKHQPVADPLPELDSEPTPVTAVAMDFEIIPPDLGLAVSSKTSIEEAFLPFFAQAKKMQLELSAITSPKIAKAARIEVKKVRTAAEKTRESMKREYLIMGRAIDAANRLLLSIVEPLEKSLEDIELAEARKLVAEREAWTKIRLETIQPYLDPSLPVPNLMDITDAQFESMLEDAKVAHAARVERERKAEEDRLAKEQAERDRLENLRKENERLKQEADAAAKKLAEERAQAAKVLAAQQAKAAQDALEAKRKADAQAELLRQERLGREAAEKKAQAPAPTPAPAPAPAGHLPEGSDVPPPATDKEKLLALAKIMRSVPIPVATSLRGGALLKQIVESRDKFAKWIEDKAQTLDTPEPPKPEIDL